MQDPIKIWTFYEAPEDYQSLSPHGGDEDWIAFIPSDFPEQEPSWMDEGGRFGCCSVSRHEVEGGTVAIGAHA